LQSNDKTIKMGLAKTEKFTDLQNEIALFAKVFGHPARVAILQYLFKLDACYCGDLVTEIGLAQSTISQHLKELKHLGLIKGNVEGTSVCYCIHSKNWAKMKAVMSQFLDQDISKIDCC
jgi:ArsR family transcriptional regulator